MYDKDEAYDEMLSSWNLSSIIMTVLSFPTANRRFQISWINNYSTGIFQSKLMIISLLARSDKDIIELW